MSFKQRLEELITLFNSNINKIIDEDTTEEIIRNSINYSLLANGKRVRPILLIAITKALNGNVEKALPFAMAIECIHTYSLIHDDLPAMDNDSLRRGVPTNHIKFGEAKAILSGDGLLNLAFEIIFSELLNTNGNKDNLIKAGNIISKASGIKGMIAGQIIDIESENQKISLDRLIDMHRKKTGALIEASCKVGALIARREDILDDLSIYGQNVGLAFQIVDDILDYTGDSKLLGKNTGSDNDNNKSTFISIIGIQESKKLAKNLTDEAIEISNRIDKSGFLSNYTKYLLNRQK